MTGKMSQLTLTELRSSIAKVRRQIRRGNQFELWQYSRVIGYLISNKLILQNDTLRIDDVSSTEFRSRLTELCEQIDDGLVDGFRVWTHERIAMVLIGKTVGASINLIEIKAED